MLHRKTVQPNTLSLIKDLQSKEYLTDFLLVGGTALALQIGHRTSVDIDLFNNKRFDIEALSVHLQNDYPIVIRNRMAHAILVDINSIKTDFVFQPSHIIGDIVTLEQIKMASILEIGAMKIGAITSRGKKRDFVDLFCLLRHFTLSNILKAFITKYPEATMELAIRSLFYFQDAEADPDPNCFFLFDWEKVKKTIKSEASKL